MKRTALGAWLSYAAAGLALSGVVAGLATAALGARDARALWLAAALAYALQLLAFGLLLRLRGQAHLFMAAWLGGMVMRFAALGLCAYWVTRTGALPRGTTLLSFVGFVFLLLLLEPVFLRWDMREP